MMMLISPEQVRQAMGQRQQEPARRLPKRLRWTLPLLDEVTEEVKAKIDNRHKEKRKDYSPLIDEVMDDLKKKSAGEGA